MANGMKGGAPTGDASTGQKGTTYVTDFSPLGPDVASREPLVMDGMSERPGPPYEDLRSVRKTEPSRPGPVHEVRLTLDGDTERYVWSLNNTPLFESDAIKIKRGETVRFIMINRTMMHHPMHLHGHFFRVLNGQGDHAPLKHTVDVPPMETTVIEFQAEEVGDWFFHCHLLYHLASGMARVVHYDGFAPSPATAEVRDLLYRDPYFAWGTADLMSNMTQGSAEISNTRNIFMGEWEVGWTNVPDTTWEITVMYQRYFNRFFRLFAGVHNRGEGDGLDFDIATRGVFGVMYKLPLNIDSMVWVDTEGGARVTLSKEIPLTPRLSLGAEVRYDTHNDWEGACARGLHAKQECLHQWHSEYGWGGGVRVRF